MTEQNQPSTATKRVRKMAREPKSPLPSGTQESTDGLAGSEQGTANDGLAEPMAPTKIQIILGLLRREEGASLDQLVDATGWLPHTTRAALTGLKKKGHVIASDKVGEGPRNYRVVAAAEQRA